MRLKRYGPLLDSTLKARAVRPLLSSQLLLPSPWHHRIAPRRLATVSAAHPETIAVLGGGIAGLASAYFLSKDFPNTRITIFEAAKETGGWIKSRRVDVPGGDVLFELGPRSLRNAAPTASLIQELGLVGDILYTKRSDPGAKNRFVYFPDKLNRLPSQLPTFGELFSLWRTGILDGAFGIIKEPGIPMRPENLSDESVGSWLARRVDRRVADNLVSAVFHGIYAGDIWQLSAKTLLSQAWQLEGKYGSAFGGFFRMQTSSNWEEQLSLAHPYDLEAAQAARDGIDLDLDFLENLKTASIFTFKDGLQHLVRALQKDLEGRGNVEIRTETPILGYGPAPNNLSGVEVSLENRPATVFDVAVSTLPNLSLTPYVTVMTVNLYYANPNLLPVEGFGYLIPQSIPFEQNPERALGVIFDSSAIRGQDTAQGTKVTVMMGGHWWNDWVEYPTEGEGLEMAKSVLQRHLNITDEPIAHCANLSKNCIPQYTVGYEDRLRSFVSECRDKFKGRLRLVGSQYNGVGVNDCITSAWHMARSLRGESWKARGSALQRAEDSRPYQVVPVKQMMYYPQNKKNHH